MEKQVVILRRYTRADKRDMLRRTALFFGRTDGGRDKLTRETLRGWRRKPNEVYLIEHGKAVAGFLCLGFRGGNVAWMDYIFVDEALRGQGIAAAAVMAAENIVQARKGYNALCVDIKPSNSNALRLCSRLGYDTLSLLTLRKNFNGGTTTQTVNLLEMELRY